MINFKTLKLHIDILSHKENATRNIYSITFLLKKDKQKKQKKKFVQVVFHNCILITFNFKLHLKKSIHSFHTLRILRQSLVVYHFILFRKHKKTLIYSY